MAPDFRWNGDWLPPSRTGSGVELVITATLEPMAAASTAAAVIPDREVATDEAAAREAAPACASAKDQQRQGRQSPVGWWALR